MAQGIAQSELADQLTKLWSFLELREGWDGYRAPKPTLDAIRTASLFLAALQHSELSATRLTPSVVGGVGISFKKGDRKAFVEFYNNGTVHVLYSDSVAEPETAAVPPTTADFHTLSRTIEEYLDG